MPCQEIEYDLFCKACRNIQPTAFDFIVKDNEGFQEIGGMNKTKLLAYYGEIPTTYCPYCGRADSWEVLRIEQVAKGKIANQFIVSVTEEPERLKVSIEKGSRSYTLAEIELALNAVELEAERLIARLVASGKNSTMINDGSTKSASVFLVVDLFADGSSAEVSILDITNMPAKVVLGAIDYLRQQLL